MSPNSQSNEKSFAARLAAAISGLLCLLIVGQTSGASATFQAGSGVDFNFHVRPILADRCFTCHGPDEGVRKADLRLDVAEAAVANPGSEGGSSVIVPGHPEKSEFWRRIISEDPDEMMPPPRSKLTLTSEEKALLGHWISEGAVYQRHWAFVPVREEELPRVKESGRARNPIDTFVSQRLERDGLTLAREASPETLLRRLSFGLRGLPPTVEELDAFLNSGDRPLAYERMVERFLASPAYGEHQARHWLDLARYADTFGYQMDVDSEVSPWRDWVIRAFNHNLRYDEFLRWQLAGDLLPDSTPEKVLATAFNRLHRQTNEGGSIEEEFRTEYVADRVDTFGTAMLGLTLSCARCHDHKYDPITQNDYYRVFAFFNNIDESGLYSHFTRAVPTPTMLLYPEGAADRHEALKSRIASLEQQLVSEQRQAASRYSQWSPGAQLLTPLTPVAHVTLDHITHNACQDEVSTNSRLVLIDAPLSVAGREGQALQFSGDNSAVFNGAGDFNRTTPFSFALWLKPGEQQERAVVFHRSRAWTDSGSRGYELVLENGKPTFSLIHFWPGNALKVAARRSLPASEWSHLAITYDGSSKATGLRIFLDGAPLELETVRDSLSRDILHRQEWGDSEVGQIQLTLAGRFRDSGFKNGVIDEFQVYDQCLTAWEVKRCAGLAEAEPGSDALLDYYVARVDEACHDLRAKLHELRREENVLVNGLREMMVMKEMPQRRPTFLLKRGSYNAPGPEVTPGTPEAVLPFPPNLPPNRLGLAEWVVSPTNPLTARVAVNRVWRQHFGRGIVPTEEDFGIRGKLPSHPELLDWLAARFMSSGWDLKALHKLIVTSAAYRQSSEASPELLAEDPDNLLLARGPKQRLSAEEIRDSALAVSGLLSSRIGGPSVKPYQPEGLWEQSGTGKHYVQDKGEGLFRRSMYTFWRRTAPPPSMLVFDAPSREVCLARRDNTTTPLQALVLLNDPQFVEAARGLAETVITRAGDDLGQCILEACRRTIGRKPFEKEDEVLRRLYKEQLASFRSQPGAAEHYLKTGSRSWSKEVPAEELAAMSVVASALMNLDEFVTTR